MKGPGARYDVDVRRVWECPACGQRMRLPATVATRRCKCTSEGTWMRIVDEHVRRTFPVREKIVIPEELPPPEPPESTATESADNPDSAAPEVERSERDGNRGDQSRRGGREKPGQRPRGDRHSRGADSATGPELSGGTPSPAESPAEPPAPPADPPEDDGFGANIF